MTHLDGTDVDTTQSPRYETPTFDPRGAFAWTLRSGEVARLERHRPQNGQPDRGAPVRTEPYTARQVSDYKRNGSPARRYETPTFDPRDAFAWTLRSGEIARLERQQRLSDSRLDVLNGRSLSTPPPAPAPSSQSAG